MKNAKGYTLTEILVVISIMILVMGVSIFAISTMFSQAHTTAAEHTLSAFICRAKVDAEHNFWMAGVAFGLDDKGRSVCYWVRGPAFRSEPQYLELRPNVEPLVLNPNVRVQLLRTTQQNDNLDKYVTTGVILFNWYGQLVYSPYTIKKDSALAKKLNLTNDLVDERGCLSVRFFDLESFKNNGGTDGDWVYRSISNIPNSSSWENEQKEEQWIEQNSSFYTMNRHNGTLNIIH